jgi:hypothetical protein
MTMDDYAHIHLLLAIEEKSRLHPHLAAIRHHAMAELALIAEDLAEQANHKELPKAEVPEVEPPIYPKGSGPVETNTDRRV